ncbi:V-set and immunoglobulin domain-containing protein 10 [Onychomys torridus]|uniref:V-set and immunoglobulin domain-containing protein 10 n=1 Tax=Onychomys torridus TaxID=38674 RepID=UPI00167F35F5|nr:V-set and immunoglobulin domain-containing protein 10 [Onychomys torridus]
MAGLCVLLCLGALLASQGSADLGAVAVGKVHENVTLPCGNVSGSRGLVTWYRNDSEPVFLLSSNSSLPPASPRFSLEDAGALHVEALRLEDDGNYTCQEVLNETHWFPVWLRVASGPDQIAVNISTTGALSNGTLYAAKGSQVDFSCHSTAQPPPEVEWCFQAHNKSEPFGKNLTANSFTLLLMSQNLQGNYTCSATNVLSGSQRKVTTELLVYWPPPSAPRCSVEVSSDAIILELSCNWDGGYPDPTFLWTEEPGGMVVGNSELQTLSPSQLSEGRKFKCVGSHIVGPESGASCVVQISPGPGCPPAHPFPRPLPSQPYVNPNQVREPTPSPSHPAQAFPPASGPSAPRPPPRCVPRPTPLSFHLCVSPPGPRPRVSFFPAFPPGFTSPQPRVPLAWCSPSPRPLSFLFPKASVPSVLAFPTLTSHGPMSPQLSVPPSPSSAQLSVPPGPASLPNSAFSRPRVRPTQRSPGPTTPPAPRSPAPVQGSLDPTFPANPRSSSSAFPPAPRSPSSAFPLSPVFPRPPRSHLPPPSPRSSSSAFLPAPCSSSAPAQCSLGPTFPPAPCPFISAFPQPRVPRPTRGPRSVALVPLRTLDPALALPTTM